jgi:hypothetical protein
MRENAEGMVPEDGVALYPLPDTSIHDDAFNTALSARSHAVGCWIWAEQNKANILITRVFIDFFILDGLLKLT